MSEDPNDEPVLTPNHFLIGHRRSVETKADRVSLDRVQFKKELDVNYSFVGLENRAVPSSTLGFTRVYWSI